MGARKVGGAVLAVLACPCHLPIYLLALGAFGVGTAAVIGYLSLIHISEPTRPY